MKAKGIGICEWALPTPLRGPLVCRVLKDLGLAAVELKLGTVEENVPLSKVLRTSGGGTHCVTARSRRAF